VILLAAFHPYRFVWDPGWMVGLAAVGVAYPYVVRRYERRGSRVPLWRRACFFTGLAIVVLALFSPVEHLALTSMVSAHLLQNVMIVDWGPPLLVLGVTPAMAATVERHLPIRGPRLAWVGLAVWLAAFYTLHLPFYYDYALTHYWALDIEHVVFIVAGVLFWWPELTPGHLSYGQKVIYLFAAFLLIGPLDLVLALAGTPIYTFYLHTPKLWGLSPLQDQQIGAITMTIEQNVILFAACGAACVKMLAQDGLDGEGVVEATEALS